LSMLMAGCAIYSINPSGYASGDDDTSSSLFQLLTREHRGQRNAEEVADIRRRSGSSLSGRVERISGWSRERSVSPTPEEKRDDTVADLKENIVDYLAFSGDHWFAREMYGGFMLPEFIMRDLHAKHMPDLTIEHTREWFEEAVTKRQTAKVLDRESDERTREPEEVRTEFAIGRMRSLVSYIRDKGSASASNPCGEGRFRTVPAALTRFLDEYEK
jgi:hypothetical protein